MSLYRIIFKNSIILMELLFYKMNLGDIIISLPKVELEQLGMKRVIPLWTTRKSEQHLLGICLVPKDFDESIFVRFVGPFSGILQILFSSAGFANFHRFSIEGFQYT